MHILIADDDPVVRLSVAAALHHWGHEVVVATDGADAWARFERTAAFGAAILDWTMPGLDGLKVTQKIRDAHRDDYTYIILLTAKSGRTAYRTGITAGAEDFLTKPVDFEELEARLVVAERVVRLRRRLKQLEDLLPVCMYCHKIRSSRGSWMALERYVAEHTRTTFSHGCCTSCYERFVQPDLDRLRREPPTP